MRWPSGPGVQAVGEQGFQIAAVGSADRTGRSSEHRTGRRRCGPARRRAPLCGVTGNRPAGRQIRGDGVAKTGKASRAMTFSAIRQRLSRQLSGFSRCGLRVAERRSGRGRRRRCAVAGDQPSGQPPQGVTRVHSVDRKLLLTERRLRNRPEIPAGATRRRSDSTTPLNPAADRDGISQDKNGFTH